jgi:hypothetical protein
LYFQQLADSGWHKKVPIRHRKTGKRIVNWIVS